MYVCIWQDIQKFIKIDTCNYEQFKYIIVHMHAPPPDTLRLTLATPTRIYTHLQIHREFETIVEDNNSKMIKCCMMRLNL